MLCFTIQVDSLCVKLSPVFEDSEGELELSQLTSEDEEKPPSLTEQALGIKQALTQLAEMASGQVASVQAQNTIRRLQEERCVDLVTLMRLSLLLFISFLCIFIR